MGDGSTDLQSPLHHSSITFRDYRKIGDKQFPGAIQGFNGKKLITTFRLAEIGEVPDLDARLFLAPVNSSQRIFCSGLPNTKLKERQG
jgi:hypothetical protein